MPRPFSSDAGTTHVLEAVIVASIMLSAIAFVATFENPTTSSTPTRDFLETKARDALTTLWDTPVKGSDFGDNLLSIYLAQCMQGNCTNLTGKLDKLLPIGASYAIYVSNGVETYPVYITRQPVGEAVTAKILLEPHWSYTFTSTGLSNVNNATDPNVLYSLPVFNSNVISPGGSPLKITVQGHKQSDGSTYVLETFATTQAVDASKAGQYPAVSLNFLTNKTGTESWGTLGGFEPGAYWYAVPETMNAQGFPSNKSVTFRVRLQESAGVAIPAGTELTVNIPRGWNASGWENETWDVIQNATDWNSTYNGSDVIARLLYPVQSSTVEFNFNATYRGDLLRFYPFRAALTRGANAEANLIVGADHWPENTQTFAIPRVVASVPRPMGATATTTWSLAVNIPYNPVGGFVVSKGTLMNPNIPTVSPQSLVTGPQITPKVPLFDTGAQSTNIVIDNITIVEQDGAQIFGSVAPVGQVGAGVGTWRALGDRLIWEGKYNSTTQGTLNLTFQVTGAGKGGRDAPKLQVVPPVGFDKFSGRLLAQTGPGFYRDAILPNNTTASYYGYNVPYGGYAAASANATSPLTHNYTSSPLYRATQLPGKSNYTVNPASPFSDALYGSYVAVEKRTVPVGGQVLLTANVQSMLYALSAAGQSAGVNLSFYPPWSGNSKIPIYTLSNLDSGILTSSVTQLAMIELNGDAFPDPVVGTDQGRVIAFDALTGNRIQGSTWIAPIVGGQSGVAVIRHLSTITLGGVDYFVVATDGKSGVYIVDKTFQTAWSWDKTAETQSEGTSAIDTSTDIDLDGRRDVVVALDGGGVFVLRALVGNSILQPLIPATPPPSPSFAFAKGQGTPAAAISLPGTGSASTRGVGASFISLPGADLNLRVDRENPLASSANPQIVVKTPRAGMNFYDNVGAPLATFLGTPITVVRPYDYDADGRTEVLAGSTAGHVFMLNGMRQTQPAVPMAWTPVAQLIDADALDPAHTAFLSEDGVAAFTYDGWNTHNCVSCDPNTASGLSYPTANGIAMNSSVGLWLAGDASTLWRSVDSPFEGYPFMSSVLPINATKNGLPYTFPVALHRFNDVDFLNGSKANVGVVVGSPNLGVCTDLLPLLQAQCDEGLVMRTTDGGQNWVVLGTLDGSINGTAGPGSKVSTNLTRVNFTNDDVGWIVGESGTLLRTLNGGASWKQIALPTTAHIRDVSCAPVTNPTTCIAVGDAGVALRTQNAQADVTSWPTWQNITTNLSLSDARPLKSVGMVDTTTAYVGTSNKILRTIDGGNAWTDVPMGYLEHDGVRMSVFPDGTGFVYGGNATVARQFWLHSFMAKSSAYTTDITAALPLPVGSTIHEATLKASLSATPTASATPFLSRDGGSAWAATAASGVGTTSVAQHGNLFTLPTTNYTANLSAQGAGTDVRVRIDLQATPDMEQQTAQVQWMQVDVRYSDPAVPASAVNRTFVVDLASTAMKDAALTTATWDTTWRTIHTPTVNKFWSRNVSGSVLDIQTGFDVTLDGKNDVWVATGGVLAENSPDYQLYAGTNVSKYVEADNRVYLLNGANGTIINKTAPFSAEVMHIRVADDNLDGKADIVFAVVGGPSAPNNNVYAFNATTLAPIKDPTTSYGDWQKPLGKAVANDVELARNVTNATLITGLASWTNTSQGGNAVNGGAVEHLTSYPKIRLWNSKSDERGAYYIQKEIPKNWFFGPYVVEVSVDWKESVTVTEGGSPVNKEILQAARFYDYFLVSPPDALNPPSPVYSVHLVAWMQDWR